MQNNELPDSILKMQDDVNSIIATAGKIHSEYYARALRACYNMAALTIVKAQVLADKNSETRSFFARMDTEVTIDIVALVLPPIHASILQTGKSITLPEVAELFQKDLQSLISRATSGNTIYMEVGPQNETERTSESESHNSNSEPQPSTVWTPKDWQDKASGNGSKDSGS